MRYLDSLLKWAAIKFTPTAKGAATRLTIASCFPAVTWLAITSITVLLYFHLTNTHHACNQLLKKSLSIFFWHPNIWLCPRNKKKSLNMQCCGTPLNYKLFSISNTKISWTYSKAAVQTVVSAHQYDQRVLLRCSTLGRGTVCVPHAGDQRSAQCWGATAACWCTPPSLHSRSNLQLETCPPPLLPPPPPSFCLPAAGLCPCQARDRLRERMDDRKRVDMKP